MALGMNQSLVQYRKYSAPPDPLEREKGVEEMTATNRFRRQRAIEYYQKLLRGATRDTPIFPLEYMKGLGQSADFRMSWIHALTVKLNELLNGQIDAKIDDEYVEEFHRWLLGKSRWNTDPKKTPWGTRMLVGESIIVYIREFIGKKKDFEKKLVQLKVTGPPMNIEHAWLYFKYIVTEADPDGMEYLPEWNWWTNPDEQKNKPNQMWVERMDGDGEDHISRTGPPNAGAPGPQPAPQSMDAELQVDSSLPESTLVGLPSLPLSTTPEEAAERATPFLSPGSSYREMVAPTNSLVDEDLQPFFSLPSSSSASPTPPSSIAPLSSSYRRFLGETGGDSLAEEATGQMEFLRAEASETMKSMDEASIREYLRENERNIIGAEQMVQSANSLDHHDPAQIAELSAQIKLVQGRIANDIARFQTMQKLPLQAGKLHSPEHLLALNELEAISQQIYGSLGKYLNMAKMSSLGIPLVQTNPRAAALLGELEGKLRGRNETLQANLRKLHELRFGLTQRMQQKMGRQRGKVENKARVVRQLEKRSGELEKMLALLGPEHQATQRNLDKVVAQLEETGKGMADLVSENESVLNASNQAHLRLQEQNEISLRERENLIGTHEAKQGELMQQIHGLLENKRTLKEEVKKLGEELEKQKGLASTGGNTLQQLEARTLEWENTRRLLADRERELAALKERMSMETMKLRSDMVQRDREHRAELAALLQATPPVPNPPIPPPVEQVFAAAEQATMNLHAAEQEREEEQTYAKLVDFFEESQDENLLVEQTSNLLSRGIPPFLGGIANAASTASGMVYNLFQGMQENAREAQAAEAEAEQEQESRKQAELKRKFQQREEEQERARVAREKQAEAAKRRKEEIPSELEIKAVIENNIRFYKMHQQYFESRKTYFREHPAIFRDMIEANETDTRIPTDFNGVPSGMGFTSNPPPTQRAREHKPPPTSAPRKPPSFFHNFPRPTRQHSPPPQRTTRSKTRQEREQEDITTLLPRLGNITQAKFLHVYRKPHHLENVIGLSGNANEPGMGEYEMTGEEMGSMRSILTNGLGTWFTNPDFEKMEKRIGQTEGFYREYPLFTPTGAPELTQDERIDFILRTGYSPGEMVSLLKVVSHNPLGKGKSIFPGPEKQKRIIKELERNVRAGFPSK